MSNHATPLPWALDGDTRIFETNRRRHRKNTLIVQSSGFMPASRHKEEVANFEFIVRACNAHYDLLEALNDVSRELDMALHRGLTVGSARKALENARAAIAKAEGGTE